MRVARVVSQPMDVNVWVIEDAGEALVVDTGLGRDLPRVLAGIREAAGSARVKALHLSHPHCDHVAAARALGEALGCEVTIEARDAPILEKGDAEATLGAFLGVAQEPCRVRGLAEGSVLPVGDLAFEVLVLPGHTPHHSALWDPRSGTLVSGDVVFAHGSFGRVDFPGGDGGALVRSLRRLAAMPVARVLPGHMEPIDGDARARIRESLANAERMLGGEE